MFHWNLLWRYPAGKQSKNTMFLAEVCLNKYYLFRHTSAYHFKVYATHHWLKWKCVFQSLHFIFALTWFKTMFQAEDWDQPASKTQQINSPLESEEYRAKKKKKKNLRWSQDRALHMLVIYLSGFTDLTHKKTCVVNNIRGEIYN